MAKMTEVLCECGIIFEARTADVERGWGKSCGKSCAAKDREKEIRFVNKIKGKVTSSRSR